MSKRHLLLGDLNQLRREKRWRPLTHQEADTEIADTPYQPLSEAIIDDLVHSAKLGGDLPMSLNSPNSWMTENDIADYDPQALLLNWVPDEGGVLDEGGEGLVEDFEEPSGQEGSSDVENEPPDDTKPCESGN
jgi:hypothetical protein